MNLEQLRAITVSQLQEPSKKMLTALQNRGHLYAGTVPAEVVARRRAANKQARKSRAINRKASR